MPRPKTPLDAFEKAIEISDLTESEQRILDYIRYIGTFTQPSLVKALGLNSKPPVLSTLCSICRKIGKHMPVHFAQIRKWSQEVSESNVRWDGNLVCSIAWNIDGESLSPESGTAQYHTFSVHKELFLGLD